MLYKTSIHFVLKLKAIFICSISFISTLTVAQSSSSFENLSIDRPDVSNLPVTVKPGHFQFETGTEFYKNDFTRDSYLPNFILRTGITNKSEFRLGINNLHLDSLINQGKERLLFITLSAKYRIWEEKGARPAVAIQPEFGIPFGEGKEFHRDHANIRQADYALFFLFNNTLHEKIFINYNAGLYWNKNGKTDYLLSASTSFMHTHRLGYFLEAYSLIENPPEFPLSFDAGITYLIAPRLQVDAYLGNREDGEDRYWFYGFGFGFRMDANDLKPKSFKDIGIHH